MHSILKLGLAMQSLHTNQLDINANSVFATQTELSQTYVKKLIGSISQSLSIIFCQILPKIALVFKNKERRAASHALFAIHTG